MRYHHTMTYDASAPAIYKILTDPAFQAQRCSAGKPVDSDSSVEPAEGDGATITVMRKLRIDPPGFVKKFTGDELTIHEVQEWRDSGGSLVVRDGRLSVKVAGQPADVEGTLRMDESGGTTTVTIDAEVKVRVPLFGAKVETYIGEILDKLLSKDEELGRAWLAEQHG